MLQISNEISVIFQVADFPPAHNKLRRISEPFAYADPNVLRSVYQGVYQIEEE